MTPARAHSELAPARAVAYRTARRRGLLGHPVLTLDDLAQAALLRLVEREPDFDPERGAWPAYANRAMYQGASDLVRRVFGYAEGGTRPLAEGYADVHHEPTRRAVGARYAGTPSDELDARLDADRLCRRLTDAERWLVREHYGRGTPQRDIALRLGISTRAAQKRIQRALYKLRNLALA